MFLLSSLWLNGINLTLKCPAALASTF